jgi:organic radical activating enzyme
MSVRKKLTKTQILATSKPQFPINTGIACPLKWGWSTIRLHDGDTSSCHRVESEPVSSNTFINFHNTPLKLVDRQKMLAGEWPGRGCEFCQKLEVTTGISDRLANRFNQNLISETSVTELSRSPSTVEVYFDNTCNLSCLYCNNGFSSKIHHENVKFGKFEQNGVVIENTQTRSSDFDQLTDAFWDWFTVNSKNISQLNVLGGEPLYQWQFDKLLDLVEEYAAPKLELNIVTNLMISSVMLEKKIERVKLLIKRKKLKKLVVVCSIDCFGKEQEYVRFGLDLTTWKTNFDFLLTQPWIDVCINQTLSSLTITSSPEMVDFIASRRSVKRITHYFSTVVMTYSFLHPGIFGPGFFDSQLNKIIESMPQSTDHEKLLQRYMISTKNQINAGSQDINKISQLITFLNEKDRRRNTNWRDVFPWLEQFNVV